MIERCYQTAVEPDAQHYAQAQAYQNRLTKPQGSLGKLEQLGASFSAFQQRLLPELERIQITIFAADHGVAAEGVSAYPQVVTAEMIRNFAAGGAAICVLARQHRADFAILNLGTVEPLESLPGVEDRRISAGSANFCNEPAMTQGQLEQALEAGFDCADRAAQQRSQLFIGGEMGIANTTSATALAAVLLQRCATELVGPGTGIDEAGLAHKSEVIERALERHQSAMDQPIQVLRHLGGLEIAALVGAYIGCAQRGVPVLVDGFICTAAALVASRINPSVRPWLLFAHNSAEPGHRAMQQALAAEPLLDLGMRLGEGSGAALAIPLLQSACKLQSEMATFAQAEVTEAH